MKSRANQQFNVPEGREPEDETCISFLSPGGGGGVRGAGTVKKCIFSVSSSPITHVN